MLIADTGTLAHSLAPLDLDVFQFTLEIFCVEFLEQRIDSWRVNHIRILEIRQNCAAKNHKAFAVFKTIETRIQNSVLTAGATAVASDMFWLYFSNFSTHQMNISHSLCQSFGKLADGTCFVY